MYVYVESTKNTNVRFEVLKYDAATKTGLLKGEYGAEFSRDLSKESLAKYGYKIRKSEQPLELSSQPKPPPIPAKDADPEPPKKKKPAPPPVEDDDEDEEE